MYKWLVVLLFCISFPSMVCAQEEERNMVQSMKAAFQGLDYELAEEVATEILARYELFSVDALIETHVTLALIRFSQNRLNEAEIQFISALSLNPNLELDPVLISPKVRTYFEDLKASMVQTVAEGVDEQVLEPRYIFVRDPRPAAAIRSMLIPGWGQFYKDEPVKGYVFTGVWVSSVGATIFAHIRRQDAARSYRIARNPNEITDKYDTYNRTNKLRNALFLTAASVWAVSYIDALLTGNEIGMYSANDAFSFSVHPAPDYPYAEFRIAVKF